LLANYLVTDLDSVARTENLARDLTHLSVHNKQKRDVWAGAQKPVQGAKQSEISELFWTQLYRGWQLPSFQFQADARSLSNLFSELVDQNMKARERVLGNLALEKELDFELYVYCLLNALYGNPNLQMHQVHPKFKGIVTLQECRRKYGNMEAEDGMEVLDRKRKNAVTELLRFICTKDISPSTASNVDSLDEVYRRAYYMVINGDLDGASDFLSDKGKYKMAGFVAQCISNDSA